MSCCRLQAALCSSKVCACAWERRGCDFALSWKKMGMKDHVRAAALGFDERSREFTRAEKAEEFKRQIDMVSKEVTRSTSHPSQ